MNNSYASTFTQHLILLPSNSIKLVFLYLPYCSAVITMTLLLLLLLVSYEQGELMVCGMDFRKPGKREYTVALSLCLFQHPPEVSHCSRNRILVSSGKGLNFIKNDVVLLLKYDRDNKWFDFHTIRKAQM